MTLSAKQRKQTGFKPRERPKSGLHRPPEKDPFRRPAQPRTPSPSILKLGKDMLITMKQRGRLIKLDPLKILDPAKKKLAAPEAQRLIDVIDETKKKSDLLILAPLIAKDIEKFESSLGAEVVNAIKSHQAVFKQFSLAEGTYWEFVYKRSGGKDQPVRDNSSIPIVKSSLLPENTGSPSNGNKLPAINVSGSSQPKSSGWATLFYSKKESQLPDISASYSDPTTLEEAVIMMNVMRLQLEDSARNLLRVFRDNRAAVQFVLQDAPLSRTKVGSFYVQYMSELRDVLLSKLLMSPLEQQEKMQFIAQIAAQERTNAAVIEKFEKELHKAVEERDSEIRNKNDYIKKLQNDLHVLEKSTEDDIRRTKTESEKQIFTDKKIHDAHVQKYESDLKHVAAEHEGNLTTNRDEELALRRKKWKVETETENWLIKYDAEMTEKQDEYERLDAIYQEEKKQLIELEERFAKLEIEYKGIIEDKRTEKLKREAMARHDVIREEAARVIQATWRAAKVHRAIKLKDKLKAKSKKKHKQNAAMKKLIANA